MSADGTLLFEQRGATVMEPPLYLARPTSVDATTFTDARPVSGVNDARGWDNFGFISESTGELFFTSVLGFSPSDARPIWRAQVCRDAPCVDTVIDCSEVGGVRSLDSLHCYWLDATSADWATVRATCEAAAAHLVTLTSPEEDSLLRALRPAGVSQWLGGFDEMDGVGECATSAIPPCTESAWITGERWRVEGWFLAQPNDLATGPSGSQDRLGLKDRGWHDDDRAMEHRPICEREVYPTW